MRWGDLMFGLTGRIDRARFWAGYVAVLTILVIASVYALSVNTAAGYTVYLIAYVVTFWSSLALYVKRFHDRNKAGWWALIGLIPFVGPIWMAIELGMLFGTTGPNRYGPDPRSS